MTEPTTPAGWYPDASQPGTDRYWDGTTWTHHTHPHQASAATSTLTAEKPVKPKRKIPLWVWIVGGVVVFFILIGAINGAGDEPENTADTKPVASEPAEVAAIDDEEEPAEEEPAKEEVVLISVPDVVGMTVAEAKAAVTGVDLKFVAAKGAGGDWVITKQNPAVGRQLKAGQKVKVASEAPLTMSQINAVNEAIDYLDYSGFSLEKLIDQLEYEGYSNADATYGAKHAGANWNEEAAETAQDYLDYSSFSREGLADQLDYEGFTGKQIAYALNAVGY